jgi:hypothetical protein
MAVLIQLRQIYEVVAHDVDKILYNSLERWWKGGERRGEERRKEERRKEERRGEELERCLRGVELERRGEELELERRGEEGR